MACPCCAASCNCYTALCNPFPERVSVAVSLFFNQFFPPFNASNCPPLNVDRSLSGTFICEKTLFPEVYDCFRWQFAGCTGGSEIEFIDISVGGRTVNNLFYLYALISVRTNGGFRCGGTGGVGPGQFCGNTANYYPHSAGFTSSLPASCAGQCLSGMSQMNGGGDIQWTPTVNIIGGGTGTVSVSAIT